MLKWWWKGYKPCARIKLRKSQFSKKACEKVCANCDFWEAISEEYLEFKNKKDNTAFCDRPFGIEDPELVFEAGATAYDDSGMDVFVITSGNFGCKLFKEKKK